MTRARMKKLKASNETEDSGIVSYMEKVLKNNFKEFKGQEKTSKLFTICSISKDYPEEIKEKGKEYFPRLKVGLTKWVPIRRIEKGKIRKNSDYCDPGGAKNQGKKKLRSSDTTLPRTVGSWCLFLGKQEPTVNRRSRRKTSTRSKAYRERLSSTYHMRLEYAPFMHVSGNYYPELVSEFYENMFYKMDKHLSTIISTVKGVRILFDKEHLAFIMGIRDKGITVTIDSNKKSINEGLDWNYEVTCNRLEICLCLVLLVIPTMGNTGCDTILTPKGVKDLRREEEAIFEQSNRRNLGRHLMHNNQWEYGNFSSHARSYGHNFYDCYEGNRLGTRNGYYDTSCKRVLRIDVRNGGNYVNIDDRFHKRKESEHLECSKKKDSELEKSERIKENECFIEKQESETEEQRGKEIVVLEKSEEVNFYANLTNSSFASELLCVKNFGDSSKDEEESFPTSLKTINFFPFSSYLSFEIYFKEIKLFSLVFMANGYQFYFFNSLGNLLKKKYFIEFNFLSCVIPRIHEYYDNVANYASCMLGIEDEGRSMEEELGTILEELPIRFILNPSLMCYEVSFVKLKFFLESYLSHVSICSISFGGGLFLVVSYASRCLFSHAFLEDSLLHSSSMLDPSCHDFRVMNNASIESIVVGFGLYDALFDTLHDKYLGKFVENVGYVSSFLDTFMENHNDFVSLNQLMPFMSCQVEFSCNKQKLSNHFKEWFLKNNISLVLFWNNSWALILKLGFEASLFYHLILKAFFDKMDIKEEDRPSWNYGNLKSIFSHLPCEMMEVETHQGYAFMSNAIPKIIEECEASTNEALGIGHPIASSRSHPTIAAGLGTSSSQPAEDENEDSSDDDGSYDPCNTDALPTIPMDAFRKRYGLLSSSFTSHKTSMEPNWRR
ncbi:hypothetical protein M9H77_22720 [Catharanthus roseus]|uniref:Uncharacterized protein n=1 Tax=Catharanthus roseus TaxID=4058 RepID=A0ACC0ASH9_CATRO|nr:hypothetical protein M9H77_22720 [Catharanthus roseus]